MPNIVHLPICPFYRYEKRKSVCCEDTYRGFRSVEDKYEWMYMYCDTWDWAKCPYAADLSEAYEQLEKGDGTALEKHEKEAMKKEMKSLSTKLGKAEKKIERMHQENKDLYRKWREAEEKLRDQDDRIWAELGKLTGVYEQRMCYLIDRFAPSGISEKEVEAWAADKEFALIADMPDKESDEIVWKVLFKKETEDGQQDQDVQNKEQK